MSLQALQAWGSSQQSLKADAIARQDLTILWWVKVGGCSFDGNKTPFSDKDCNTKNFVNNKIYKHKVIHFNYTTYDMWCLQDSINLHTHADVMVLSHEDPNTGDFHPYWYTHIIGIFHAQVWHIGPESKSEDPQKMVFLWVHWFGHDLKYHAGWAAHWLHHIRFVDSLDPQVFGFLNPCEVI